MFRIIQSVLRQLRLQYTTANGGFFVHGGGDGNKEILFNTVNSAFKWLNIGTMMRIIQET